MLRLVPVHHHSSLGLEFPRPLVHVQDHDVHPEVHRSLLGAEPGAETGVEKQHKQGLVSPE